MAEALKTEFARELGRDRWRLLAPALVTGALSGLLATCYALLTFPAEGTEPLRWATAVLLPVGLLSVVYRLRQRLQALWALGDGTLPASVDNLKRAMREVSELADFTFRNSFVTWGAVLLVQLAAMKLGAHSTPGMLFRLLLVGMTFAPLTGFSAQLATGRVSRKVLARLSREGLSLKDVLEALPPRRFRLRAWLVFFILSSALTPMVLIMDASLHLADRATEAVLRASDTPGMQRVLADEAGERVTGAALLLWAISGALALGTAAVVGSALRDPMREIAAQATRITEGRLDRARMVFSEDEVWVVSATFSQMQDELSTALMQLQQAGLRLSTSSEQLVDTFGQQEGGAAEQASALNETSATTEELARSAAQIAENAGAVAEVAERTLQSAQSGQRNSETFFVSMQKMGTENQAVADSVLKLNKRVQQIGKIVEFIHGIADKSDLLALNAELEGTKAGEVGRGFSLVAAEMRRLAENVLKSTQEIERLIQEIRDATHAAVMATEAGMKATERGTTSATAVMERLNQIVEQARATSNAVRSISLATQQQQSGTDQLAEAMSEILRVTQQSSAATRQMSAANLDLAALAKDLKAVVDRFQVNNV